MLHEPGSRAAVAVDPGVAEPVIQVLAEHDLDLVWILNTHHHPDHTGGNLMLQHRTNCRIAGPAGERDRIPGLDHPLAEDDEFYLFSRKIDVLDVGGHTLGHLAYVLKQDMKIFCGDALFAMGCGRLFEGTAEQAWHSLGKLRALDDDMMVYCAHEYTANNARFALTITPGCKTLKQRVDIIMAQRAQNQPTVPFRLGDDKRTNPFLRADDPDIATAVGLPQAPAAEVFAELRRRKDMF